MTDGGNMSKMCSWNSRGDNGFSSLMVAFLLLALSIPIVFVAESVLVAGRQAASSALGQENLRAVDGAMESVVGDVRLDPDALDGCQARTDPTDPASANRDFVVSAPRPSQGAVSTLDVTVKCITEAPPADGRLLTLEAYLGPIGSQRLRGKARVHIIDKSGAVTEPGADMVICDWRLGEDATPLNAC